METVFERLQRSVPVNKMTALGIAHTPEEAFGLLGHIDAIKYIELGRDGFIVLPTHHEITLQLQRLQDVAQRAMDQLGLYVMISNRRKRGLEWFHYTQNQAIYRVRLVNGTFETTEIGGRFFFRHRSQKHGTLKVYSENELAVDMSKVPPPSGRILSLGPYITECVAAAPKVKRDALEKALREYVGKHGRRYDGLPKCARRLFDFMMTGLGASFEEEKT